MARPRSADHDIKRRAILDRSAKLFAQNGYDRTSMAEVASACGVSKALLYHYYAGKETLLFDILSVHLQELLDAAQAVDKSLPSRDRLRALSADIVFLQEVVGAHERHAERCEVTDVCDDDPAALAASL